MEFDDQFAEIAVLIGDPARAVMLWNLLDGKAYTAGELALVANISAQSASNHLSKLVAADFLKVEKQGKHRYFKFTRSEIAYAIEALASLIPDKKEVKKAPEFENGSIRYARTCYDHLAGKIAVDITEGLLKQELIMANDDSFVITSQGNNWFSELGINVDELKKAKRLFAKPCIDWSERKNHLAGALGAALLQRMEELNWIRRKANTRIVVLTAKGEIELNRLKIME